MVRVLASMPNPDLISGAVPPECYRICPAISFVIANEED
jgi:hypothetical protein